MKKRELVLIEDDLAVNESVVIILQKSGYVVHAFLTAEAFNASSIKGVAIYLIDRQLKGSDGLEICRRLKSEPDSRETPVLIMSASPDVRQYAEAAGADGFLEKPFSKKQLLTAIERLMK